jgi:hypothetical protein
MLILPFDARMIVLDPIQYDTQRQLLLVCHCYLETLHHGCCLQTFHLGGHIRELALLQLRLPKDRIHITKAMLHPPILFNMVQVDKPTGVRVPMHSSQDTAASELERFLGRKVISVLGIEDAISEGLTGADAEEVASEASAIAVDVVQGGSFLGSDTGAHCALWRASISTSECFQDVIDLRTMLRP